MNISSTITFHLYLGIRFQSGCPEGISAVVSDRWTWLLGTIFRQHHRNRRSRSTWCSDQVIQRRRRWEQHANMLWSRTAEKIDTVGPRYNVIVNKGHSIQLSRSLGSNETISIVVHLVISVLQYNSQNAEVQMASKQPGPAVLTFDWTYYTLY